jgi:hypothetical protein
VGRHAPELCAHAGLDLLVVRFAFTLEHRFRIGNKAGRAITSIALDHVLVAKIPGPHRPGELGAVVALGILDEARILLRREELVLGNTAISNREFARPPLTAGRRRLRTAVRRRMPLNTRTAAHRRRSDRSKSIALERYVPLQDQPCQGIARTASMERFRR